MVVYVDIDGVLCTLTDGRYEEAQPLPVNIAKVNSLYDKGHHIVLWTARGAETGIDWTDLTTRQMRQWGVRYHNLRLDKPFYDRLIDDKSVSVP